MRHLIILALLALIGCSKDKGATAPTAETPKSPDAIENFQGMTTAQILQKKYKDVSMVCGLRMNIGPNIEDRNSPVSTALSDLKTFPGSPILKVAHTLPIWDINAVMTTHTMNFEIKLKNVEIIPSFVLYRPEGTYTMQFTPRVEVEISWNSKTQFGQDFSTIGTGSEALVLYENIENPGAVATLGSSRGGPVSSQLNCKLSADLNLEYRKHFKFEKK